MTNAAYSRIVVAVDGSATADLALGEAIRVAGSSGATVLALFIVDSGVLLFDAGYYDVGQMEKAYVDSGNQALEQAAARL